MPSGCPKYTLEIAEEIVNRLSSGESLRSICRDKSQDKEFPSEVTVRRWALEDREGFAAQYARAREIQMHAMADELLEIADDGSNDWLERHGKDGEQDGYELNHEHVQRSRHRLDTRKWLMSKVLPKVYGDRVTQEHTGQVGFVMYGEREKATTEEWTQANPPDRE